MAAGSIVIDLLLRSGAFETDTKRAEKRLAELKKEAQAAGKAIGAAFAGVAVAAAYMVKASIDSMDEMLKLSQTVGVSVEALSALKYAADLSGVSQEQLGSALTKLTKNMSDTAQGTGEAMKGFEALGISVKNSDGTLKSSDKVLTEIAGKFAGFKDGAEKTALAVNLFGKAGAELIPLLNSGAQGLDEFKKEAERLGIVIGTDAAKAAEVFNDNLSRLKARVEGVSIAIASGFITSLNSLISKFDEMKAQSTGGSLLDGIIGNTTASRLTSDANAISAAVSRTTDSVERMNEELNRRGGDDKFLEARIKKARERLLGLQGEAARTTQKLKDLADMTDPKAPKEIMGPPSSLAGKGAAPRIPGTGGGDKDDPTKKLLENRIKAIDDIIKRERDSLDTMTKALDRAFDQNLSSISEYYTAKRDAQTSYTDAAIAQYDREIAAVQDYAAKTSKATDKATAAGKVADIEAKKRALLRDTAAEGEKFADAQEAAMVAYQKSVVGVNASLLEMQGNLAEAARLRFDLANSDASKRAGIEGDSSTVRNIESLRSYAVAQAGATKLSGDAGVVLDQLRLQEDRLAISRQLGASTELDSLFALGSARQGAVRQMEAIVGAQEAIAKASENPGLILNAEKARVALEQLRATADPLAEKFQGIFSEGLGEAFGDFITGTKSASEAFKSFANSVISQLARMAAQQLVNAAVGQSSGFFSSIFGAGGSSGTGSFQSGAYSGGVDGTAALPEFAAGTNFIPYDNFPALLHKGEKVVPAKYNPDAGGEGAKASTTTIQYNVAAGVSRNELMAALQLLSRSLRSETDKKLRDKGIA